MKLIKPIIDLPERNLCELGRFTLAFSALETMLRRVVETANSWTHSEMIQKTATQGLKNLIKGLRVTVENWKDPDHLRTTAIVLLDRIDAIRQWRNDHLHGISYAVDGNFFIYTHRADGTESEIPFPSIEEFKNKIEMAQALYTELHKQRHGAGCFIPPLSRPLAACASTSAAVSGNPMKVSPL